MIREAKPEDFEDIWILLRQLYVKDSIKKSKTRELFLSALNKDSIQLLMEVDDEVIGYSAVFFTDDIQVQGRVGHLSELIIGKEHRGNGFGTRLLERTCKIAKRKRCKELQFPSNFSRKRAHRFYENLGFNKTAYYFWKEL